MHDDTKINDDTLDASAQEATSQSQEKALIVLQERTIDFHGDELLVVLVEVDGERQVYVPIRQFCKYLGLDWSAQYRRIERDEELQDTMICVALRATQISKQGYYDRPVLCLPLDLLPGWLFGIMPSRVRPALAPTLRRYRRECFRVLWQAAQQGQLWQNIQEEEKEVEREMDVSVLAGVKDRVWNACVRAIHIQLPATLTVEQWLQTLEHFKGKCAYCQQRPGIIIEHFIPLPLAGTTAENCVPSCYACNAKKGNVHPDFVTTIPRQALDSIQAYLFSVSEQMTISCEAELGHCGCKTHSVPI